MRKLCVVAEDEMKSKTIGYILQLLREQHEDQVQ